MTMCSSYGIAFALNVHDAAFHPLIKLRFLHGFYSAVIFGVSSSGNSVCRGAAPFKASPLRHENLFEPGGLGTEVGPFVAVQAEDAERAGFAVVVDLAEGGEEFADAGVVGDDHQAAMRGVGGLYGGEDFFVRRVIELFVGGMGDAVRSGQRRYDDLRRFGGAGGGGTVDIVRLHPVGAHKAADHPGLDHAAPRERAVEIAHGRRGGAGGVGVSHQIKCFHGVPF